MKKRVITICGELGAGKSTTTRMLRDSLGYEYIYAGGIQRQLAEELGMSFDEFHKLEETDQKYDMMVDEKIEEFLTKGDDIICDSYIAPWIAPDSFKVFLNIDPKVAAERMFEDQKTNPSRKTEKYDSVEKQLEKNRERTESNILRFRKYNNIENYLDKDHYDIVVDTTNTPPDKVIELILDKYNSWLNES